MDYFNYKQGQLFAEDVSVSQIVTDYQTPCYIYSRATLEKHWHAFDKPLQGHPHKICYAVKANSNLAILNLLARLGSGFDIVSIGELERVLIAGGQPENIVFSGIGKTEQELKRALEAGIYCFNVESSAELIQLNKIASQLGKQAPLALRINPNVDAQTHPYISTGLQQNKFGIPIKQAKELYLAAAKMHHLKITGIAYHIGSQLTDMEPLLTACEQILELIDELATLGIQFTHIDIGGGLGVKYKDETPPLPHDYAAQILAKLAPRKLTIIMEPGRAMVANAGILITKIEYLKYSEHKNFAIVDAAMNDLLRPALYQAWQTIIPVQEQSTVKETIYDIVGPVCESGDFLGKDRKLAIAPGDLLAIRGCGAYGFAMSSNYNSRPRAAEILVDKDKTYLIRQRETLKDLYNLESIVTDL